MRARAVDEGHRPRQTYREPCVQRGLGALRDARTFATIIDDGAGIYGWRMVEAHESGDPLEPDYCSDY
jgi:hypothetical protein